MRKSGFDDRLKACCQQLQQDGMGSGEQASG
jgi:hypothetical protein